MYKVTCERVFRNVIGLYEGAIAGYAVIIVAVVVSGVIVTLSNPSDPIIKEKKGDSEKEHQNVAHQHRSDYFC